MIFKLSHCEYPYEVIENYISNHSEVIEDMVAVIEIDGVRRNELLEYDFDNDSFMFLSDWWEGEQEVALIDFFPVSEACNPKTSIPIEWIQNKIDMLDKQNAEPPGMTLRLLLRQWYAEQEKQKCQK